MRALALAIVVLALGASKAYATFPGQDVLLLSGAASTTANGAARHAAISQDGRVAQLAAFESDATNLAPGAGATTNVYVVRRAPGFGTNGTPWAVGSTVLASVGMGGQPANGASTAPSLDGTSRVAPHRVAFVSAGGPLPRRGADREARAPPP